jgi:HD-GYP domain-containing protein (c-di-GMP phosphodiesterase class II)
MIDSIKNEKEHCCSWCKKLLTERNTLIRGDELFCCEGCYLGKMASRDGEKERDVAYLALVESLASALDAREHETGLHSKRVACYTLVLARRFTSDKRELQQIYWGALLHDIGKIAIPDAILLKADALDESEWEVMQSHPQRGHDIIANVPFMHEAAMIILCHEEHYDGNGYPQGLSGDDIPWGARLFSVIDTLDAITSDRPYRKGMPFDTAKQEITVMSGSQFDPKVVDAFIAEENTLREMVELKCEISVANGV